MNFIKSAREAVATYSIVGNEPIIELQQLLAVVIGSKATPEMTGRLAQYGVKGIVDLTIQELETLDLSHLEALRLHSAMLLANKLKNVKEEKGYIIRSPEDGADLLMEEMKDLKQEHFVVLFLSTKNEVIKKKTIFIGSLNASIVHPREIFSEVVKCQPGCASIIICHNHPSGDPTPSQEDIHVTKRVVESGKIIGCEVLDHLIIGQNKFVSLKEKGYI